jgi:tRNA threonylcarbamoyladenosine biosynthesis protein TsaB
MGDGKRILAIEASGRCGSVALLMGQPDDARLIGQTLLPGSQRTAQTLVPTLDRLLNDVGWLPASIQLVAAVVGPGSFTGLRIGVTTAKAFAYAVGAEIIGVNTLETIVAQVEPSGSALWVILDAQRQDLLARKFVADETGVFRSECDAVIISQTDWLAGLERGERVVGPPLGRLSSQLPAGVSAVPTELWHPLAVTVGMVGWRAYQAGQRDDIWKLVPNYYRPSAAEEKAARLK